MKLNYETIPLDIYKRFVFLLNHSCILLDLDCFVVTCYFVSLSHTSMIEGWSFGYWLLNLDFSETSLVWDSFL